MDCIFLLVLMLPVFPVYTQEIANINESTFTPAPTISFTVPTTIKPHTVPLTPAVGGIKVKWSKNSPCQGDLYISRYIHFPQNISFLCYNRNIVNSELATELCEERRCGQFVDFNQTESINGYMIYENLTVNSNISCKKMHLTCKDKEKKKDEEKSSQKELVAYKVITGLLLTLIIGVLLSRFAQPMYIAVRKRFSQKRQNRWIGPTQSQSVSYHRGQSGNPNNNTMKRQSYPGLERLTVYPSREPSSNRNSDYDSYGN